MNSNQAGSTTILCPTRFERSQLLKAPIGRMLRESGVEVVCTGPGAERMVNWAERHGPAREGLPNRTETRLGAPMVILAGLAGGLRPSMVPGTAYLISTVIAPNGRQFRSTIEIDTAGDDVSDRPRRAVVACSEAVATSPKEKSLVAERTGADLVDLESAVFAEAATIFGWRWAIVRGVSDGHASRLPPDIGKWVRPNGSASFARTAASLLKRPWFLVTVAALRRSSIRALCEVGRIVNAILLSQHRLDLTNSSSSRAHGGDDSSSG